MNRIYVKQTLLFKEKIYLLYKDNKKSGGKTLCRLIFIYCVLGVGFWSRSGIKRYPGYGANENFPVQYTPLPHF